VKLHTFGKMVPQFAYLSIGSFLYESLSCPYNQNHKEHFCFDMIIAFEEADLFASTETV